MLPPQNHTLLPDTFLTPFEEKFPWFSGLRTYQKQGAQFLIQPTAQVAERGKPIAVRGRLLADPPGFGKTTQLLAAARLYVETGRLRTKTAVPGTVFPIICICPAMATGDWVNEVHNGRSAVWRGLKTYQLGWSDRKLSKDAAKAALSEMLRGVSEPTLIISSYERAKDILAVAPQKQGLLLLDEAHYTKNDRALRTNVARRLTSRSEWVFLSTGTPLHRRAFDAWQLLDFCAPGAFGSSHWKMAFKFYDIIQNDYGKTVGPIIDKAGFAKYISGLALQRTVEEAYGELPSAIRKLIRVESKNPTKHRPRNLPALKDGDEFLRHAFYDKLPAVIDLALELDEPKIIYTWQREHAEAIWKELTKNGVQAVLAHGDIPTNKRQQLLEAWKQGQGRDLVCTMDAVTISFTGVRARAMLFADVDNSATKMGQCEGRIDPARQQEGERSPARYYYFAIRGGYDEVVCSRVIQTIDETQGILSQSKNAQGLRDCFAQILPKEEKEEDVLADLRRRMLETAERLEEI